MLADALPTQGQHLRQHGLADLQQMLIGIFLPVSGRGQPQQGHGQVGIQLPARYRCVGHRAAHGGCTREDFQIAKNAKYDAYRDSVDFYKHYEADLDRAAALGVKVFRISIEWARGEPQPGVVDPAALAFYDAVIQRIVKLGMRPMLTLDHWVYPGWMLDRGGWASAEMPANWLSNARRLVDRYAGYAPIRIAINEPTFYLNNEIGNGGLKAQDIRKMNDGMVAVHRAIYDYIHARQPGSVVSSNVAYRGTAGRDVLQPCGGQARFHRDRLLLRHAHQRWPAIARMASSTTTPCATRSTGCSEPRLMV
ncbi:family 1 glycosylhydrolase [Aquabacterium sp.]|uniref:family 1 glycosylhydrolase n=1 Tax=Aquabacterium sp. TaxID=1872578 RepID=UPI0025C0E00F|nr:family 1 glycosylhydrolase [Aquabacterium sp.]